MRCFGRDLAYCLALSWLSCFGWNCTTSGDEPQGLSNNVDRTFDLCLQDAGVEGEKRAQNQSRSVPDVKDALPQNGVGFIDDLAIRIHAERQVNKLIQSNRATKLKKLAAQLTHKSCEIQLSPRSNQTVSSEELYTNQRDAVVVVMVSRKHNDHWHVNFSATGFLINSTGAMVTNQHVIRTSEEYLFAMTTDGKVHPVQEILASNAENDAAICQLVGSGFKAVPLREDVAVGSPVRLISHPKGRLYSLTSGIVSRRHIRMGSAGKAKENAGEPKKPKRNGSAKASKWITITAPFGKGSSGGPVFDPFGNVVAVATLTSNITVEREDDAISQYVFHDCVPAEVVLGLIGRAAKPANASEPAPK